MIDAVVLREHEPCRVDLDQDDTRYLLSEFGQRFTIQRDALDSSLWINPNQFVGVLTLPSGQRLEVWPKVPIANLFQMLAVAYRLWPFRAEEASFERLDDLLHLLAVYFIELVESRLRSGLYRSYVDESDNLTNVRGRILFAEDVRRNAFQRHRTYCQFSTLTWDVPENQIIRQVVWLLRGWSFPASIRRGLAELDARLADITPTFYPSSILDRFQYDRLNADYEPIHQLCRLFLDGASVSESPGRHTFRSFLIDMNRLFESFVTQVLIDHAPRNVRVAVQSVHYFDQADRVALRPDILLSVDGQPRLVLDCKYKRVEGEAVTSGDLYQMLAYCTAMGLERGTLLYPDHEAAAPTDITVRRGGTTIGVRTVPLADSAAAFNTACRELALQLLTEAIDQPHRRTRLVATVKVPPAT